MQTESPPEVADPELRQLREQIGHAIHYLPTQGPISVFVHHNTLHSLEELPFEEAVLAGSRIFGSEPWWPESRYREELASGRIRNSDLEEILLEESADPEYLVGAFGTRFGLRLAMLQFQLQSVPEAELRWILAETSALERFRDEVPAETKALLVDRTCSWLDAALQSKVAHNSDNRVRELLQELESGRGYSGRGYFIRGSLKTADTEALTLHLLWQIVEQGVRKVRHEPVVQPLPVRPRDRVRAMTGSDPDQLVHEILIRFSSAFLDQGFAPTSLPDRNNGFARSFARLYGGWSPLPAWMRGLVAELKPILQNGFDPLRSIQRSLLLLEIPPGQRDLFLQQTLLALGGWAGMIWQMETKAPWTPRPAPEGSLLEFLAIRLILDRFACHWFTGRGHRAGREQGPLPGDSEGSGRRESLALAYTIFQLAQVRGWQPAQLFEMTGDQWQVLADEIARFDRLERRRVLHLAYERRFRNKALNALSMHTRAKRENQGNWQVPPPEWQVVTCIDDREESFRRHMEEIDPRCQTFAAPGFFAVVMYYRGADHAHFRPLCPINVVPKHFVEEEPLYSLQIANQQRAGRRAIFGQLFRSVHAESRTLAGGIVTGLMGTFATVPLVGRVLAPRLTARIRRSVSRLVQPVATELHLVRQAAEPGPLPDGLGFSTAEMAAIVRRLLEDIGLTRQFAPVVLFLGHGSSSLNNPHESAYNCGACSGGHGGPNARALAWMANQPAVRKLLQEVSGISIPEQVHFVGGYHNTCNDEVDFFDLDYLPWSLRQRFQSAKDCLAKAVARNSQERSRRFQSVPLDLDAGMALEAVGERSEDLSQVRPEYNHATTAMCLVGRRDWSRGLFLDRRAFLASYDPAQDGAGLPILARILAAAIPVCGGISLEYLFSSIDPEVYGCGSKLPHNIVSLAGVMTGALSDLRPGLSQQMTEIHEPIRLLFVVESTSSGLLEVVTANPVLKQMVFNDWVQLATIDPATSQIEVFRRGRFEAWHAEEVALPTAGSSREWYCGHREHLPFAQIRNQASSLRPVVRTESAGSA